MNRIMALTTCGPGGVGLGHHIIRIHAPNIVNMLAQVVCKAELS